MSPALSLKRVLFGGGGGGSQRIPSNSPLYDVMGPTAGRNSPVEEDHVSSCDSSIGRNSDFSSPGRGEESSGEAEVQSALKGPLDTMDVLELVLPINDGTPSYYRGKSKPSTKFYGMTFPLTAEDLPQLACTTSSNRKRKKHQPLPYREHSDSNTKTPPKDPSHGRLPKRAADVHQCVPTLGPPASSAAASSSSGSNISATSFEEEHDAVSQSWLQEGLLAARCR